MLSIYVNVTENDNPRETHPQDYVQVDVDNDYFIFGNGSATVADGEDIPTNAELDSAGSLISESATVHVDKCFLADVSEGILREVFNFGRQNKQYVFCFVFDSATASEPILEVWDDENMDTVNLMSLGQGTPNNSWWRGIVTTDSAPGVEWAGSPLAGSTPSNFLYLNNGSGATPITEAKDLFANLRIQTPAGFSNGGVENPVIVCKYTAN